MKAIVRKRLFLFLLLCLLSSNCGQLHTSSGTDNDSNEMRLSVEILPTPERKAPRKKAREKEMDNEKLADILEKTDQRSSQLVRESGSTVETLITPFLRSGAIYQISKFLPTRLRVMFVGCDSVDSCNVLTGNPKAYFEFVEKAGFVGADSDQRLAYAISFLSIAYSPNKRLQILQSVSDLTERPNLKEDDRHRFVEFREKFAPIVKPPGCSDNTCTIFVVKGQELVRLDLEIEYSGRISVKDEVLEKDILIPYAL